MGTPQKITDDSQVVTWAASYDPFGEVTETVAVIENNIRFPGQYEDGETGLHYNYFRDYDPSLGRYVESDPRGISYDFSDPKRQLSLQSGVGIGGISKNPGLDNTFNYAGQNPLIMVDATGEIYGLIARVINTAFRKCVGSRLACGAAGGAFGGYKVDQRLEVQRRCQLECEQATQQCTEKGDTRELNRCKTKCVETSWGQKFRRAPWVKKL